MESFNKKIHHGACISCDSQEVFGHERCKECRFFHCKWSKPDLRHETRKTNQMTQTFITTLNQYRDITVYSNDSTRDLTCDEVTVTWEFAIEMRAWGVKSIVAYATYVEGLIIDEETGEMIENLVDYTIESEIEIGDTIQVHEVEIDMKNKVITVL